MAGKKKVAGSRPAKVEVEIPGNIQSAAERKAAEAELKALIAKFTPMQIPLVAAVRRWFRKRLPSAFEVGYEYRDCFVISISPNEHGYAGVFGIRGSAEDLRLYFTQSKELPDPGKLLQGTGKQARWINVDAVSTLTRSDVAQLIEAAIARNSIPFSATGLGAVIIRSTSAKKAASSKSHDK